MNLRQASLCLDCDELLDSDLGQCPHCASTCVHPLAKFLKPMPAIKVIETTGKVVIGAAKKLSAPKASGARRKKPAAPGNGSDRGHAVPAPVRYIGTLQ